jgi:hypothetical protein
VGPPDEPPYTPSAQPPKSNKALIIILIVVLLLLCACCAIAGGGYMVYDDILDEMVLAPAEPVEEPAEPSTTTELTLEEQAAEEWLAWEPGTGDYATESPTSFQRETADAIMAQLYPSFVLDELRVSPGGVKDSGEGYWADEYLIRAHLAEHPEVEIIELVRAPCEEGVEEGATSMNLDSFSEGSLLGTLENGCQYVYPGDNVILEGPPEDIRRLLIVVAEQWPGGTVTGVARHNANEDAVVVYITSWEHWHTSSEFEGVSATYVLQDGEWVLDDYEWTRP